MQGLVPACVEVCKCGALTFEDPAKALKRKTDQVSQSISAGVDIPQAFAGLYPAEYHQTRTDCRQKGGLRR